LVVEDDETLRIALRSALSQHGYRVHARSEGNEVARVLAEFRPDLAILDVNLPGGPDGLTVARHIRERSDLPVVFLTAASDLEARLAGFQAGADDYLVKPFAMAELLARVQVALRRSGRRWSGSLEVGDVVLDERARVATRAGQPLGLTHKEYELLKVLVQHPGTMFSKAQLLGRVWGFEASDPNLVEVHLSALRRKLEAFGPRLIHTARGLGYVLEA
jgi:DNA-binding response OmpR family regulator